MTPDQWFSHLSTTFPAARFDLSDDDVGAVLDIARIAAHTSERWTAPVSTFLLGLALAKETDEARSAMIRGLVDELDQGTA